MTERGTKSRWRTVFFPEPERSIPGERKLRVVLRTAHIGAMALLLGGHAFGVAPERLHAALAATVVTGLLFVLLEVYGTCNWCFEVRGLATILKVGLVALVPVFWEQRVGILFVVLVLGSVVSHTSARWRYYSVLTGRPAQHKKG